MADYVVTIRTKDGSLAERDYAANDRAELFQKLAADGVTAVRVSEGVAGKKPRKAAKKAGAPSKGCGLLAAAIVVLVAGIAAWFMWPEETKRDVAEAAERKVEMTPAERVSHERKKERKSSETPKSVEEAMVNLRGREKPEIKLRKLSPEEWLRITNRVFKTGTEQLMSIVFSTEVGEMPMPIPPIGEEDRKNIVSILLSKNEVKDTDSERVKECKENVAYAKKEMIAYIKEGGDPDGFLQYYFQELKSAFELRNEAISQITEVWSENPELGRQFLEKVNEKFTNEGIKLINKEEFE
jgi:hypothetical protein